MRRGFAFALIGAGVAAVATYAASRDPRYRVERSAVIPAPVDEVYTRVSNLELFDQWSPWARLDPQLEKRYSGRPGEIGSSYGWAGNHKVGEGQMTLTHLIPNSLVEIRLEFFKPFPSVCSTRWSFEPEAGGGTRMTWTMDGENSGLAARFLGLLMNYDKMIGGSFEEGLANLKACFQKAESASG